MYKIDRDECIECALCQSICPKKAITKHKDYAYEVTDTCVSCSLCAKNCPVGAISKE